MTPEQQEVAKQSLEKAFRLLGGVTATAVKLGISQPRVSNWRKAGHVSDEMVQSLARVVSPRVTRAQLRPDIYGKA